MSSIEKKILRPIWRAYLRTWGKMKILYMFLLDCMRFCRHFGANNLNCKEAALARIVMGYHVVEKGLTMPNRQLGFGKNVIRELICNINQFETFFGTKEQQVNTAIGVIRNYAELHQKAEYDFKEDIDFKEQLYNFVDQHKDIPLVPQYHFTREQFYASNELPFPQFAESRHTVRHFTGSIKEETIKECVGLAMTAPSACNRQHTRVHCVCDHGLRDRVFALQGGNRGFGSDADKILVVTTDLLDLRWAEERNDAYTNAGIFIMNLCYALHYYKIAHCILHWSVSHGKDKAIRRLIEIPDNENIVVIIACGNATEMFDVARSTRKSVDEVLSFIRSHKDDSTP
jgi:nitroreductase